ncbi:hypothetical protein L1987_18702 [Smallanthus sonchifolius]|uniref:Uncharacterized protein n=1 Tax=Smallanthus sonchifolius TaxID=185202 RepID=A0ACB9J1H9_9ASTR|nr:hypothetical protein L1987_18702 [Smallanthus sonchifolius]
MEVRFFTVESELLNYQGNVKVCGFIDQCLTTNVDIHMIGKIASKLPHTTIAYSQVALENCFYASLSCFTLCFGVSSRCFEKMLVGDVTSCFIFSTLMLQQVILMLSQVAYELLRTAYFATTLAALVALDLDCLDVSYYNESQLVRVTRMYWLDWSGQLLDNTFCTESYLHVRMYWLKRFIPSASILC